MLQRNKTCLIHTQLVILTTSGANPNLSDYRVPSFKCHISRLVTGSFRYCDVLGGQITVKIHILRRQTKLMMLLVT